LPTRAANKNRVLGDAGKDALGQSRTYITLEVYAHLIPGMQSEVADLIDELAMPVAIQIDQNVS
jgi:hypothetical protein